MRPGGVWVQVAAPAVKDDRSRDGRVRLRLASATPGASFAYTTEAGDTVRWTLSTGEIDLPLPATVRVKACRLGYLDSSIVAREYR
jgi:hypothetical protein